MFLAWLCCHPSAPWLHRAGSSAKVFTRIDESRMDEHTVENRLLNTRLRALGLPPWTPCRHQGRRVCNAKDVDPSGKDFWHSKEILAAHGQVVAAVILAPGDRNTGPSSLPTEEHRCLLNLTPEQFANEVTFFKIIDALPVSDFGTDHCAAGPLLHSCDNPGLTPVVWVRRGASKATTFRRQVQVASAESVQGFLEAPAGKPDQTVQEWLAQWQTQHGPVRITQLLWSFAPPLCFLICRKSWRLVCTCLRSKPHHQDDEDYGYLWAGLPSLVSDLGEEAHAQELDESTVLAPERFFALGDALRVWAQALQGASSSVETPAPLLLSRDYLESWMRWADAVPRLCAQAQAAKLERRQGGRAGKHLVAKSVVSQVMISSMLLNDSTLGDITEAVVKEVLPPALASMVSVADLRRVILSKASLSKYRFIFDAAFSLAWRVHLEEFVLRPAAPVFLMMDASPKYGKDWMIAEFSYAHGGQTLFDLRGWICDLRDLSEKPPPLSELDLRRQDDLSARVNAAFDVHILPPTVVGSGRGSAVHKTANLFHSLFLESPGTSWHSVRQFCQCVTSITTDQGVESLLAFAPQSLNPARLCDHLTDGNVQQLCGQAPSLGVLEDKPTPRLSETQSNDPTGHSRDRDVKQDALGDNAPLFPNALWIPGALHMLHSGCRDLADALPHFASEILPSLRVLVDFVSSTWVVERFKVQCLRAHPLGSVADATFKHMDISLRDWRWGSLLQCVDHISEQEVTFRVFWNEDAFKFKGAAGESGGKDDTPQGGDEGFGSDSIGKVSQSCKDVFFWAYLRALRDLGILIKMLELYFYSCPCHGHRTGHEFDLASPSQDLPRPQKPRVCQMMGRLAPEMATGAWRDIFKALSSKACNKVMCHTIDLGPEQREKLLSDISAGLENLSLKLSLRFGYWEKLPYHICGLAHSDEGVARSVAITCLQMYDQTTVQGAEHAFTEKFLSADHIVGQQLREFARGAPIRSVGKLLEQVVKLRLMLILELSIEAKHALVTSRTRAARAVSGSLYSFSLRLGEARRRMELDAQWFDRVVEQVALIRKLESLVVAFGLHNHPAIQDALDRHGRLTVRSIKDSFYHSDLITQFLKHGDAQVLFRKVTRSQRAKQPTSDVDGLSPIDAYIWRAAAKHAQERLEQGDWICCSLDEHMNITAMDDRMRVAQHSSGTREKPIMEVLATSVPAADATLEPLGDTPDGTDHGGSVQIDIGEPCSLLPYDAPDLFSVLASTSCGVALTSAGKESTSHLLENAMVDSFSRKFVFCRIVHTTPHATKRPLHVNFSETRWADIAVTLHAARSGKYDGQRAAEVALDASGPENSLMNKVCMWLPPMSVDNLASSTVVWRGQGGLIYDLKGGLPVGGVAKEEVADLVTEMVNCEAFIADWDLRSAANFFTVAKASRPRTHEVLTLMADAGLVVKQEEFVDRSSWSLSKYGLSFLDIRVRLTQPRRFFSFDPESDMLAMTDFELVALLRSKGWDFKVFPQRSRRANVPGFCHNPGGDQDGKYIYIREKQAALQRAYLLALASAELGRLTCTVHHLRRAGYYWKMLRKDRDGQGSAEEHSLSRAAFADPFGPNIGAIGGGGSVEDEGMVQGGNSHSEDEGDDLETLLGESDGGADEVEEDTHSTSSSSSGSSSNSSSKRSAGSNHSRHDRVERPDGLGDAGDGQPSASVAAVANKQPLRGPAEPPSFWWGLFLFTWCPVSPVMRKPRWQVTCPKVYHPGDRNACRVIRTVQGGETAESEASRALVCKLKQWCMLACQCDTQLDHRLKLQDEDALEAASYDDASRDAMPQTRAEFLALRATLKGASAPSHGVSEAQGNAPDGQGRASSSGSGRHAKAMPRGKAEASAKRRSAESGGSDVQRKRNVQPRRR